MFFLLGLSIVLAVMLALNTVASLVAYVLWKLFADRINSWSAASAARTLFLLRTVPVALGLITVVALFVPAYLAHEPRDNHEEISLKLGLLALLSASGIALALIRGIAAWRATSRLTSDWLRNSEPIQVRQLSIPAYKVEHQFPLIAVVGALRPRLFIARQIFETLTPEELNAALEHEAGHVVAYDNLKRGVMRACRDVLLMVPFGRGLDSDWVEASEAAADEYAARKDSRVGFDLALALVKIARSIPLGARATMPAGAFLVGGNNGRGFKSRVRRLVQIASDPEGTRISRTNSVPQWLTLAAALLLIGITASQPIVLENVHELIEHAVYILG
jgi:hypothetical protein